MRRTPSQPPELPGYDVVRLLGSGGFSDVFLYDQRLPKRQVAVKVLLIEQLDSATRARFVSEANVMAQLSAHPYIVTIHHADVAGDGRPYLVMEYCSGPSLSERYKRERFGVEETLRIAVRLTSAIATAHAAGILHRDIKPGNVLTNAFGWPALTDFGIASTLEDELAVHTITGADLRNAADKADKNTGTSEGASVGLSVPWSPPEMFEDDPEPDVRSDVFSLAATVHTLLAGRTPFEVPGRSNGTLDLIGRIERGVITPIDRDDIPRSLTAVLNKGMAAKRADRFATSVDFARALQRVEMELGYAPTTLEVPNLTVEAAGRDDSDDAADETAMRSVATIPVQDEPAAKPPEKRSEPTPDADSTRLRGATVIDQTVVRSRPTAAEPTQRPPETAGTTGTTGGEYPPATEQAGHRRRRIVAAIVAGGAAVLVAAAIVTTVLVSTAQTSTDTPTVGGGGKIDVSTVPKPVLVSKTPSADGTSVTFVWKNPKPKKDDSYLWALAQTPDTKKHVTKPEAVVTGVVPGARVCITVFVLRDGQTSPNPLEACYP